jgi:hypothetical protein
MLTPARRTCPHPGLRRRLARLRAGSGGNCVDTRFQLSPWSSNMPLVAEDVVAHPRLQPEYFLERRADRATADRALGAVHVALVTGGKSDARHVNDCSAGRSGGIFAPG